jgi:hypothetical protein
MNRASGVVLVLGAVPAAALEPPGDTREMLSRIAGLGGGWGPRGCCGKAAT